MNEQIKTALLELSCPFCAHKSKSSSGRTLHLKTCKRADENRKAAKAFKEGGVARWQLREHRIVAAEEGLIILENGMILPALQLQKPVKSDNEGRVPKQPNSCYEWLAAIVKRYRQRGQITSKDIKWFGILFNYSGYVKHKRWSVAEFNEALKKLT